MFYPCSPENLPCKFQISSDVSLTGDILSYTDIVDDLGKDKIRAYYVYNSVVTEDNDGLIVEIPDELKGATVIRTPSRWNNHDPQNLVLDFEDDFEALYVAVDDEDIPTFIRSDTRYVPYQPQGTDGGGYSQSLVLYVGGQLKQMRLYKYDFGDHDKTGLFSIPGVCYGGQEGCDTLNYIVFVQPNKQCSGVTSSIPDAFNRYRFCLKASELDSFDEEMAAMLACNAKYGSGTEFCAVTGYDEWTYLGSDCEYDDGAGLRTFSGESYEVGSIVEFDPVRSIATIKVEDEEYTRAVRGSLDFEYVLDDEINRRMIAVTVNGMQARIDDVEDFSDISMVLVEPATAACGDENPPSGEPCSLYTISANDFFSSASASYDGDVIVATGYTSEPIHVRVDDQDRSFHMAGGPVVGTIPTDDGKGVRVEVTVDLYGQIVNFAPTLIADLESHTKSSCSDRTNKTPIQLYASGSFDIWDDLPSNPNEYYWYEDYRLVTEHLWGQGTHVTIPAYSLGYGVHTITLVVRDNYGVTATDRLEVQVVDDSPPSLTIPADIIRFLVPPEEAPVYIDIGQATASDGCFGSPVVTNDAPQDGMFGPGAHTVTWTADDGAGNVTTKLQKVYVSQPYEASKCSVWNVDVELRDSVNQLRAAIRNCGDLQDCLVDVSAFTGALHSLAARIQQDGTGDAGLDSQIVAKLDQAGGFLEGAEADLLLSNESGQDAATLRAGAVQKVTDALGALDGLAQLLYPSDRIDGVWKDGQITTSAVTMNFYVQTYATGSTLIIASPDGDTAYAFLDEDASDGFDANDLGGRGHRLTAAFSGNTEGTATLTLLGETPRTYIISRWFAASVSDGLSGIYKDSPSSAQPGASATTVSMNAFVQSYEDSWIAILTPDAVNFEVFLNPEKRSGADVDAMGGGAHLYGLFTGDGTGKASIVYPDGSIGHLDLNRWFPISSSAGISGRVTTASGTPLAAVEMTCSDVDSAVTDASGNYAIQPCPGWSGTVTPSKSGWFFIPGSRTYAGLDSDRANQDYVASESQSETVILSGSVTTASMQGISGVLMTFGGGGTETTDGLGDYTHEVLYNWSGTLTPSKAGYTFFPSSKTITNATESQTHDFVGTPVNVVISGTVSRSSDSAPLSGVSISYTGGSTATDASGYYSFAVSPGWSGTVTPSKSGYTFSPASKTFTNVTVSQTQDFVGTTLNVVVSGTVSRSSDSVPLSGVSISYTGGSTTTDGSGYYSFEVSPGWSGTVTPSKSGYTFSPASKTINNVSSDQSQDFVGTLQDVTVSGLVYQNEAGLGVSGVAGVVITYHDFLYSTGSATTTDGSGYYSFEVKYGWSGTLMPSKAGYDFSPPSRSLSNVTSNQTDQNFQGATQMFTISGTITASPGSQPLFDTTVSYGDGSTNTDSSGYYSFDVPYGWSGTVTPSRIGFSFNPPSRSYSNVTSDQADQDFGAELDMVNVTGTITSSTNGQPMAGVAVNSTGSGWMPSTTTDASGNYLLILAAGTDAVVTPSKAGTTFSPPSRSYTNLTSGQSGQDFVGVPDIE